MTTGKLNCQTYRIEVLKTTRMELEIPPGLTELLQDFTVQVLREKPEDILDFAANYFMKMKLKEKRSREFKNKGKPKAKGVSFNRNDNGGSDMEDHGSSSDDEPMGKSFRPLLLC